MRDFGSSVRHRLFSSTVFLMTCMFLGKGAAQDFTKAVIWSTFSSTGVPQLNLIYGNPSTYVPDIANGRNGSYLPSFYSYSGYVVGIGALDMQYSESCIYYSLNMQLQYSAQFIPRTGTEARYAYVPALSKVVTGISIDWVSSLIYWSDASYKRICMIDIATWRYWRVVVDTNLTSPQDVVVYPQQSFLFWSDFGDKSVIERYDLKTDERRILLSSPTLQRATKLVVDFANQRLFWLDASAAKIGSMNFDGSNVSSWPSSALSSASSFALFQNYIFLGKNNVSGIYIYDRNLQYIANLTVNGKSIIDMTVYSQERNPPVDSPCVTGNGGCDQLCITVTSTQKRCLCAMGFFLAPNGVNCVTKPMQIDKFLLVSDERQINIFQISVDTGEARALTNNKDDWQLPSALAFDPFRQQFYYFDKRTLVIMRSSLDATVSMQLPNVTNALGSDITSLAFDSENQTLFFVDNVVQTISAMYLSNLSTITIYSEAGSRPRTIVLDTNNRLLYWSDCGYNTIERGSKTNPNTNRMAVISGLSACAMTFAIDFQNQVMFWADASGSIEKAKLDGTARSVVFQDSNAAYTGLALDAQFIYVAASNKLQIQKIDRNTKQLSNLTKILFTQPFALLYYSKDTASTASTGSTSSTASSASSTVTPVKIASVGSTPFAGITSSSSSFPGIFTLSSTESSGSSSLTQVTIIILASVISGAVVLIALVAAIAIVVAKRRRAASAGNSPPVVTDNSRPYETLNVDRRGGSNPQVFNNQSFHADGILPQNPYASIKYSSVTGRHSILPPPYEDENDYVRV